MRAELPPDARLTTALQPWARRVRLRFCLEGIRSALCWGLAAAALVRLVAWLLAWPGAAGQGGNLIAAAAGCAAGAAALVAALWRPPTREAIALAIDRLGLEETLSSTLYAQAARHPAAPLLRAAALRRLAALDPAAYPVVPAPRRWLSVGLLTLVLLVGAWLPNPLAEGIVRARAERAALAAAHDAVAELARLPQHRADPEPLTAATRAELNALAAELAAARDPAAAADSLTEALGRLEALPTAEHVAWSRTLDRLSELWSQDAHLGDVAAALAARQEAAVAETLAEALTAALAEAAAADGAGADQAAQELARALQEGANATRNMPELSEALRAAARSLSAAAADAGSGAGAAAMAAAAGQAQALAAALAAALTPGLQQAAALAAWEQSRAALAGIQTGLTAGSPSLAGAGGPGMPGGDGADAQSGSGAGSGEGGGAGSGAGGGQGSGAGAGGGPTAGAPGAVSGGGQTGGPTGAAGETPAVDYLPLHPPTLPETTGRAEQGAPGSGGTGGDWVSVPTALLTEGTVRPAAQVWAEYEAIARESLARQPLPPNLQGMVYRYFSDLQPAAQEEAEHE